MEQCRTDVVVWGGGLGGACAALQAARSGARTILLLPGLWCGGMVSAAGVSAGDGHELSAWQTGLWGAFLRGMAAAEPSGLDHGWVSCFCWRPDRAEALLQGWLAAERTRLRVLRRIQLEAVQWCGDRIQALEVSHGDGGEALRIEAGIVVDGSDLGDLLPVAGIPFRWGWEARECWQEPSAPTASRLREEPWFRRQPVQSPTWVVLGQLDARAVVQQRRPLSQPFTGAPDGHGLERLLSYGQLPDRLVMLNWPRQGNDFHHNLERAVADREQQQALAMEMQAHSLAFLQALQTATDGALTPAAHFPTAAGGRSCLALMPYWREGRRMKGMAVATERDLLPEQATGHGPIPRQHEGGCATVVIGNYPNDHHYPGHPWPLAPKQMVWGGRYSGTPFALPYGVLLSPHCSNLLAADKAVSTSHVANGAIRLQPMVMNLGQVAGLAAALSVQARCPPHALKVTTLQQALLNDPLAPAGLLPNPNLAWHHPRWRQHQQQGLRALHHGEPLPAVEPLPPPEGCLGAHGRYWRGRVTRHGHRWWGDWHDGPMPLITLEPHVQAQFQRWRDGQQVELRGCLNRGGPWFRVEQVLGCQAPSARPGGGGSIQARQPGL